MRTIASKDTIAIVMLERNIADDGKAIWFMEVANDIEEIARRNTKTPVSAGARNGVPMKSASDPGTSLKATRFLVL